MVLARGRESQETVRGPALDKRHILPIHQVCILVQVLDQVPVLDSAMMGRVRGLEPDRAAHRDQDYNPDRRRQRHRPGRDQVIRALVLELDWVQCTDRGRAVNHQRPYSFRNNKG